MFRVGLALTIAWFAVLLSLLLGGRYLPADSLGNLYDLKPNEIGDMLAGIFAPLAFLWFFIATSMQREELELQRQELADTRKVLSDQQAELERAAKESAAQTEIMTKTLESARTRETYEAFSLQLYYISLILKRIGPLVITSGSNGYETEHYFLPLTGIEHPTGPDHSAVDRVFIEAADWLRHLPEEVEPPFSVADSDAQSTNEQVKNVVESLVAQLDSLLSARGRRDNPLISVRADSIELDRFAADLRKFNDHYKPRWQDYEPSDEADVDF